MAPPDPGSGVGEAATSRRSPQTRANLALWAPTRACHRGSGGHVREAAMLLRLARPRGSKRHRVARKRFKFELQMIPPSLAPPPLPRRQCVSGRRLAPPMRVPRGRLQCRPRRRPWAKRTSPLFHWPHAPRPPQLGRAESRPATAWRQCTAAYMILASVASDRSISSTMRPCRATRIRSDSAKTSGR